MTQVVLLGTGTPNADPDRSGPSVTIIANGIPYLVDFGPGVVRRAAAAHRAGVDALAVNKLNRAFVTYLHTDHTAGYADLIFTPWVLEREEPLEVYGPLGIREMTEHVLAAYEQDVRVRLSGLQPTNPSGYRVNVHEIEAGRIYEDANVSVEAFPVAHGSWPHAFGFKFVAPDRVIVISGDTVPSETLVEKARGCDVLVHEVYSRAGFETCPPAWQAYHAEAHTSTRELAEIASEVEPGLLILYHQLFWGVSEEDLVAEIREGYDGSMVSGTDLDVY